MGEGIEKVHFCGRLVLGRVWILVLLARNDAIQTESDGTEDKKYVGEMEPCFAVDEGYFETAEERCTEFLITLIEC